MKTKAWMCLGVIPFFCLVYAQPETRLGATMAGTPATPADQARLNSRNATDSMPGTWLSRRQEEMFRQSYKRCYLIKYRMHGHGATAKDADQAYARELDGFSFTVQDADIDNAPKMSANGGRQYIDCSWFAP